MAKMNRTVDDVSMSRRVSTTDQKKTSFETLKPVGSQISGNIGAGEKRNTVTLSHKQIEERAKTIWRQKGCPVGQDVTIWCEAENQLRQELAGK